MSPSAKTSGWPGRVRSASTVTRPARSRSAPVSSASVEARPDAVTPAAQTTVCVETRRVAPFPSSDRDAGLVDADDGAAQHRRHSEPAQRALGLCRQRWREGGEHTVGGFDEQDAAAARIGGTEVGAESVARELGDLSGHLDARGTGADHHERQPLARASGDRAPARRPRRRRGAGCGRSSALSSDFTSAAWALQSSWPK